jgi:hypothetical protein
MFKMYTDMHTGLCVKCLVILFNFNKNWDVLTC